MADRRQKLRLHLVSRHGQFVLDPKIVKLFQSLAIQAQEHERTVENEVKHKDRGKELQPGLRGYGRRHRQDVHQGDVKKRSAIDRQTQSQGWHQLMVVHCGEKRGCEQKEQGREMPARGLLHRRHDDEQADGPGTHQGVDHDPDQEQPGLAVAVVLPSLDLPGQDQIHDLGEQNRRIAGNRDHRVKVECAKDAGRQKYGLPLIDQLLADANIVFQPPLEVTKIFPRRRRFEHLIGRIHCVTLTHLQTMMGFSPWLFLGVLLALLRVSGFRCHR